MMPGEHEIDQSSLQTAIFGARNGTVSTLVGIDIDVLRRWLDAEQYDDQERFVLLLDRIRTSSLQDIIDGSDEQRQSFVNQLAMTLFAWIRKHPARAERPLQGLLVIDEAQNFVPSQGGGISKSSLMQLTQQARKYGLGLIFATQMPKGIAHQILSNCTTQMFGKQNSPTAIGTVQELLSAKGGDGNDVPRLGRGQFYMHTEGLARPVKVQTPLCLSHHPATPPSEEEVVDLARRSTSANGK